MYSHLAETFYSQNIEKQSYETTIRRSHSRNAHA